MAWALLTAGPSVALPAHADPNPPFAYERLNVANGCFVESVACFDAFHEAFGDRGWVRVLQWGAKEDEVVVAGHAVLVFEASEGLWCWDVNRGWMPLSVAPAEKENAATVAGPIVANYPRVTALYPMYWNDEPPGPGQPPPGAATGETSQGWQPARVVAERLARHRPVNLVEYAMPGSGDATAGEAVVFAFGGRLCVYTPERGTTLFRAHGSVWNVRLVMEMIHRIVPGSGQIRSIALAAPGP